MKKKAKILIIKLGALGDFIQALGPFKAIRLNHPDAYLILLTTSPYKKLAEDSKFFDEIWVDNKPKVLDFSGWLHLRKKLRAQKFQRVYDLQTSRRSSLYFELFRPAPRPEWSGIAKNCSHPHSNNSRDFIHTIERQTEQLSVAGIDNVPLSDLSWINADISRFKLPKKFALIAPGGADHRPAKRWPTKNFATVISAIKEKSFHSVIVGSNSDQNTAQQIIEDCQDAINLCGKTSLQELCMIARNATFAVGNDTGPMHIAAMTGIFSVVFFSNASNPQLCAPRGDQVEILKKPNLKDMDVTEVLTSLKNFV